MSPSNHFLLLFIKIINYMAVQFDSLSLIIVQLHAAFALATLLIAEGRRQFPSGITCGLIQ
jgi:hypothetical protein